jgi:hypothetical protein
MFDADSPQRRNNMNYATAPIPSTSVIAAGVTMLVSAWFLAASGAILTDNHSATLIENVRAQVAEQSVVPDQRVTIVVEAKRSQATL